ncbi:MAG: YhdH/YhfP family quinone oxidoreductase [Gammaproteobacteria bacterium]|uniref:YhdH/YhfP family quinone oxidoreductase n=1 Tax=Pseudomaricurvus alcaniphilus TaxID=1166482 RepID=UPI001408EC46|nr:YhdH/YhfP family quinone oxidoreductase [Pseudomaricurvus alcaniphilus]MBR9911944.1 YhdH/YhfP family quinone oxidoreductase [Gammaproteobacteria bacterium]NHN36005.1 YhdH/YhfP family quinone oxidoreductase [Pseudomaricurvus alcaniphilus]
MSDGFKALWVTENGAGNFQQAIVSRKIADLPDNSLLIKVEYSSLNYKDALSAHGNPGVTRTYPHTPGIDAAGVVVSDSSNRFKPGEQVVVTGYDLGMNTAGGLAEYIRVPSEWAIACPQGLTLREAMIYGTAGLTAALCISKLIRMGARPEDGEVAVSGATGGVGSMVVAMLSKLGFSVAAITGKLESSTRLSRLGAQKVIDRASLDELASKAMAKPQWAHAVDCLGGDYMFTLVKSLRYGGSVAACGLAASPTFKANVFPFILRNVNLLGVDSVELPLAEKQAAWDLLAEQYRPVELESIAEQITLAQVPHYLELMINGQSQGRYLVRLGA